MSIRPLWYKMLITLGLSVAVAVLVLVVTTPAAPASAQCGADASSCKRCHEGQKAYPVNTLGQWHIDHAQNDFCQLCHGGDKTTDDAAAAHVGLFDPLGERGAMRCAACHPADGAQRLATYTDLLASFNATDGGAGTGDALASASVASGYDWRNMALAGFAGVLTMISGIVVWNFEHIGDRLRRRGTPETRED